MKLQTPANNINNSLLKNIRNELQNETCEYFRNGWLRFYNTVETLVHIAEPGSKVLDLGGDASDWLEQDKGKRYVDYSFGHYFRKAGFQYSSIGWSDLDLRTDPLPFDNDLFDVVTCWETIEHLWLTNLGGDMLSWEGILFFWREAHRVLKPGGIFFVATRNRFCPLTFHRMRNGLLPQCYVTGFVNGQLQGGHIREFTGAELEGLAQETNTYPERGLLCRSSIQPEFEKRLEQIRTDMVIFLQRELKPDELADSIYLIGIKEEQD